MEMNKLCENCVNVKIDVYCINRILDFKFKDMFDNILRFKLDNKDPFVLKLVIVDNKIKKTLKELVLITFGLDHCTLISKRSGEKYNFQYNLHNDNFWEDLVAQAIKIV